MEYLCSCRVGLKREDEELTGLLTKVTVCVRIKDGHEINLEQTHVGQIFG